MSDVVDLYNALKHGHDITYIWPFVAALICLIVPRYRLKTSYLILGWSSVVLSCVLFICALPTFLHGNLTFGGFVEALTPLFLMLGLLQNAPAEDDNRFSYATVFLCVGGAGLSVLVKLASTQMSLMTMLVLFAIGICALERASFQDIWFLAHHAFAALLCIFAAYMCQIYPDIASILWSVGLLGVLVVFSLIYPPLTRGNDYAGKSVLFAFLMLTMQQSDMYSAPMNFAVTASLITFAGTSLGCCLSHERCRSLSALLLPCLAFISIALHNNVAAVLFLFGLCLQIHHDDLYELDAVDMFAPYGLPFIAFLLLLSAVALQNTSIALVLVLILLPLLVVLAYRARLYPTRVRPLLRDFTYIFCIFIQAMVGIFSPVGMMMGLF